MSIKESKIKGFRLREEFVYTIRIMGYNHGIEIIYKRMDKMKKLFLSIILTFMLIPSFVYAQVKQYVGIVRQQYYSEYVDIFKNMSKELKSEGYNTYSKAIDSYLEGGFGSGFVWVAKDGTNYIVTNRHVVANAETVSVEFEDDETGDITKYDGLKIVATDDDIDIAILAFKNGERPFAKGLEFSEAALRDGQEVWSAGFPALGDEPVWQFGKGTVTNSRARIKELLNPEISTIIQHSAQVDYGNSGGPLLISSGNKYLVVGINTWKAAYRDSANFAIPAAQIKKMINSISSGTSSSAKDRAFKLAQALGDSSQKYTSIINFISFHKASVDGQKDFESVLRFAPTSVRSTVSDVFNSNPAEGLRYACAYQLFKKYGSTEDKSYSYKTEVVESTEDKVTIAFTAGEGDGQTSFTTEWIKEHGLWRLDSSAANTEQEKKNDRKESKKKDNDYGGLSFAGIHSTETLIIKGAFELPLSNQGFNFGAELLYSFSDVTAMGLGIYKASTPFDSKLSLQMSGVVRIPLDFYSFEIVPYGEVGISAGGMGSHEPMLSVVYEAGVGFTYTSSLSFYPGFGIAFKGRKFIDFMESGYDGTVNSVVFYVSIGF